MTTAFQGNAFQRNAFQIGASSGGAPPATFPFVNIAAPFVSPKSFIPIYAPTPNAILLASTAITQFIPPSAKPPPARPTTASDPRNGLLLDLGLPLSEPATVRSAPARPFVGPQPTINQPILDYVYVDPLLPVLPPLALPRTPYVGPAPLPRNGLLLDEATNPFVNLAVPLVTAPRALTSQPSLRNNVLYEFGNPPRVTVSAPYVLPRQIRALFAPPPNLALENAQPPIRPQTQPAGAPRKPYVPPPVAQTMPGLLGEMPPGKSNNVVPFVAGPKPPVSPPRPQIIPDLLELPPGQRSNVILFPGAPRPTPPLAPNLVILSVDQLPPGQRMPAYYRPLPPYSNVPPYDNLTTATLATPLNPLIRNPLYRRKVGPTGAPAIYWRGRAG